MTFKQSNKQSSAQLLAVETMPLVGKHLIEASAGTGKTFNITRIYLRMLLERQLSVEEILVMTFTKDATQELKGRIDHCLRDALNRWDELIIADGFYRQLAEKIPGENAKLLLKKALLFLDEAAIYTIHGFCQRVLTEHAFASKLAFNVQLEADLSEIVLQASQDWYRQLAAAAPEPFMLLTEFWPTPEHFLSAFGKAIYQRCSLQVLEKSELIAKFVVLVTDALAQLQQNYGLIEQVLITPQKGAKKTAREEEYHQLISWLTLAKTRPENIEQTMPTSFFNGTRFARSPEKPALLAIFEPLKQIKEQVVKLPKALLKADAYQLAKNGIYAMRDKIHTQKQQNNVLGFDDLIQYLADAVQNNHALAVQIRQTFPVALVDEFQDTDPAQFTILESLYDGQPTPFGINTDESNVDDKPITTDTALFMIGDPKQAIYGFRGGDVFAYLSARKGCQYQWLMDTNWRSSKGMIQAYNRLFYGRAIEPEQTEFDINDDVFGYQIPYLPVLASSKAKAELNVGDKYHALQFIHFEVKGENNSSEPQKVPQSARLQLAMWCAQEIQRLLFVESRANLQAQDIAILVRDGTEALAIKTALAKLNLPCVYLSNRNNLFTTQEAEQLLTLLTGLLFSEHERLFIQALASPLLAYSAEKLYQLQHDENLWQALKLSFEQLKQHWLDKGFMSMALKLLHEYIAPQYEQKEEDKDRALTNLLHLFELLQLASQQHHQPHELLHWLELHVNGQAQLSEIELRLESDDNLIKIVTQHGSKGLEYPVVFIPFASRYKDPLKVGNRHINLIEYHDEQGALQMSLDASTSAKQQMIAEQQAESIRLLYVAITRAEQRCYILTTDFDNAHLSPIGLTLKAKPQTLSDNLMALSASTPTIGFDRCTFDDETLTVENASGALLKQAKQNYQLAKFTSKIERDWWLSSFSALTRHAHHVSNASVSRDRDGQDNQLTSEEQSYAHLLRFALKKGAQTGNFLHDIFEQLDFSSPNWQEVMNQAQYRYQYIMQGFEQEELITWLFAVLKTPLTVSGKALADIPWHKTLREAEFYFPMVNANSAQLINLLSKHRQFVRQQWQQTSVTLPVIDLPQYRKLKGMMHGFIDLIFELEGKYYVCDYKSSYLGEHYDDYQMANLLTNIEDNFYDLQYLLYSLALHRYLKTTLPDYQFERDFGGVYYLYLRGMKAPKVGELSPGVYFTALSFEIISALDAMFSEQPINITSEPHLASLNTGASDDR